MLVRVKKEEASLLRELEVATYQETFGPFIKEADMAHYFDNELSLATIEKELAGMRSSRRTTRPEARDLFCCQRR